MINNQNILQLEDILQHPASPIPEELREVFNDYLRRHHLWLLRLIALVSTAAFFAFGFADQFVLPDVGKESMLMRTIYLAITLPVTLMLYARIKNMALLDGVIPLFIVIANILWCMLLSRSASPNVPGYQYAGIIFTFVASISTQSNFRGVLPLFLANAAVTVLAAYWLSHGNLTSLAVFSIAYLPVFFFGIGGSWVLTTERRRAFLRSHINLLRSQELSALLEREQVVRQQYVRFGSLISHEFRNVLGIINSQVSTLRLEAERGIPQFDRRTTAIAGAAMRLNEIFNTWLAGDRFQNSLQKAAFRGLRIRSWLEQWIDRNAEIIQAHPVEVVMGDEEVVADPDLLEIALTQLVGNACKYSAPNAPVRIETRSMPGKLGIAVIDRGIGIAPEHQDKLQKAYFRVAPEGRVSGIGLGLTIVDQIAQLHGGSIELHSTLKVGSDFCLWLPSREPKPLG